MTRETRIGLVVGLGFIIMFGLVLTELTGTNKAPPPPSLSDDNKLAFAPVEEVSPAIGNPRDVVPLLGRPISNLPAPAPGTVLSATKLEPPLPTKVVSPPPPAGPPEVVAEVHATPPVSLEPTRIAKEAPPAPGEAALAEASKAIEEAKSEESAPAGKQYTVQPKDTLIKIARKHYGAGKEGQYKLIYEANKNILSNESTLAIGQVLVIPPLPQAQAAKPSDKAAPGKTVAYDSQVAQVDIDQLKEHLAKLDSSAGKDAAAAKKADESKAADKTDSAKTASKGTYVVKKGDTIYKIARRVFKDDSREAITKLVNANKDKLASPEKLQVGTKLEIPS